jgi:hypothetical protein
MEWKYSPSLPELSPLDEGEWTASYPDYFTREGIAPACLGMGCKSKGRKEGI